LPFPRSDGGNARIGAGIRNRLTVGDIGADGPDCALLSRFCLYANQEWTPSAKGLTELGSPGGRPFEPVFEGCGWGGTATIGKTVGEICVGVAALTIGGGDPDANGPSLKCISSGNAPADWSSGQR
jgi:hypothetical protein